MSKGEGEKSKPPYGRYAFKNPYNYALMAGVASTALLTGNWWLGLAGAGMEALWMLFAPDSRLLRKLWFDRRFAVEQEAARAAALEAKIAQLPKGEAAACNGLRELQRKIDGLAKENPAFTVELLAGELNKLDSLVHSYVDLSVTCVRYQEYIGSVDINDIERDIRRYSKISESEQGERRALAQKNLAVLLKRKDKYAEIRGYLSSAIGQLELIENTFRLLADQIVTMRSPTELSGQLDELLDGVEAVRQTTRETDKLLQSLELH